MPNLNSQTNIDPSEQGRTLLKFGILGLFTIWCLCFGASGVNAATISKAPNNLGLVGYWSFDEGTTTKVLDHSGKSNSGSTTNMEASDWVAGKLGQAISFDGVDEYASISDSVTLRVGSPSLTFSFWIKPGSLSSCGADASPTCIIFNKENSYEAAISSNGVIGWAIRNTSPGWNWISTGLTAPSGVWTHIVITYDGSNVITYKNGGASVDSEPATGAVDNTTYTNALRIGARGAPGAAASLYTGTVDEFRIYSRALLAAEVAALYKVGSAKVGAASNTGLIGWWRFDEGTGSTARDLSGRGNTASFVGSPTWTTGKLGGAINLNGTDAYLDPPDNGTYDFVSQSFTVAAWVNLPKYYDAATICQGSMIVANNDYGWTFSISNAGVPGFGYYYNGGSNSAGATASSTVPLNSWHHIAAQLDVAASKVRIYIDGKFSSEKTVGGTNIYYAGYDAPHIGARTQCGGQTDYFPGKIDDVRIFSRALSSTEIAGLAQTHNANASSATRTNGSTLVSSLVGLWTFDGADLTDQVYDRSGQSRNAYIYSGATTSMKKIGKLGQALTFSGGYVKSGAAFSEIGTANRAYSLSAWVKLAAGETAGNIIHVSSQSDGQGWCLPMLSVAASKFRSLSWTGTAVTTDSATTPVAGRWYHVVHTWDATNGLRIFVNGVLENSAAQATFTASGTSDYVWVAFDPPGACSNDQGAFEGSVDDVRVYGRALSSAEVLQLYNLGK